MASEMISQARKDAEQIANDLITKYPGITTTKSEIRNAYSLPLNRSSMIFFLLVNYGFEVYRTQINVPTKLPETEKNEEIS